MTAGPFVAVIPGLNDERFTNVESISKKGGYPVRVYECPNCHLVELYHED